MLTPRVLTLDELDDPTRRYAIALGLRLVELRRSGARVVQVYLIDEPEVAVVGRRMPVDVGRPPGVHSRHTT